MECKKSIQSRQTANAEKELKRMNWDVLGMNEVRWMKQGYLNVEGENLFLYSGNDQAQYVIGVLIVKGMTVHQQFL